MKYQVLFSLKNNKKYSRLSSATVGIGAPKVKYIKTVCLFSDGWADPKGKPSSTCQIIDSLMNLTSDRAAPTLFHAFLLAPLTCLPKHPATGSGNWTTLKARLV